MPPVRLVVVVVVIVVVVVVVVVVVETWRLGPLEKGFPSTPTIRTRTTSQGVRPLTRYGSRPYEPQTLNIG